MSSIELIQSAITAQLEQYDMHQLYKRTEAAEECLDRVNKLELSLREAKRV
jgi:hypothetical protein